MTTLEKLAKMYFEKSGKSPLQSFWAWLDCIGIDPTEKELKEVLKNFDEYI